MGDHETMMPLNGKQNGAGRDTRHRMEAAVRTLLEGLGEDPDRQGLQDTPRRMVDALLHSTDGYGHTPADVVGGAVFDESECGEIVIVRDIAVHSLCEHHMLPFFGKAHVAYVPSEGKVLGLSKVARLVELFARRLQVQERLTTQVCPSRLVDHGSRRSPRGWLTVQLPSPCRWPPHSWTSSSPSAWAWCSSARTCACLCAACANLALPQSPAPSSETWMRSFARISSPAAVPPPGADLVQSEYSGSRLAPLVTRGARKNVGGG